MAKKNFTAGLDSLLGGGISEQQRPQKKPTDATKGKSATPKEEVNALDAEEHPASALPKVSAEIKEQAPTEKLAELRQIPVDVEVPIFAPEATPEPDPPVQEETVTLQEPTPAEVQPVAVEKAEETAAVTAPKEMPVVGSMPTSEEQLIGLIGAERVEQLKKVAALQNRPLAEIVAEGIDFYLDFQVELLDPNW